jgi:hypothetical protein
MEHKIKRDIKSIVLLLATQGMINMGEIQDPITKDLKNNLEGAEVFIELLEELKLKTKGNLTAEETIFFEDILTNIKKVYDKKLKAG